MRAWSPGERIGPYRLEAPLGKGGMGSVWRARHTTGALRALKRLEAPEPEERERLRREGQALARLDHPHVLAVHDLFVHEGVDVLALALAEGDLLARLREQGPLAPLAAADLVAQLARGLEHAHQAGILHRDLKPQNVLFREGRPQLADFGVAVLSDRSRLTQSGALIGTPDYMSPEQARGEPYDERGDVYGLGAILYHCLSGRPPFAGATTLALLAAISGEEPAPLAASGAPAWLEAVCSRALAKDPAARYPSARALAEDLEARRASGERVASWLLPAACALCVLGIGAALAAYAARARPAAREPSATPSAAASAPSPSAPPQDPWRAELARALARALEGEAAALRRVQRGELSVEQQRALRAAWVEVALERPATWQEPRGAALLELRRLEPAPTRPAREGALAVAGIEEVLARVERWEREELQRRAWGRPGWLGLLEALAHAGLRLPLEAGRLGRAFVSKFPLPRLQDPRLPWLAQPLVLSLLRLDLPVYRDHFEFSLAGGDAWGRYQREQHKRMSLAGEALDAHIRLLARHLERSTPPLGPRHRAWLAELASSAYPPGEARRAFLRPYLEEFPRDPLLLGAMGRAEGYGSPASIATLERSLAILEREGWFQDPLARGSARKVLRDLVYSLALADRRQEALPRWRQLIEIEPKMRWQKLFSAFEWLPRD